MALADALEAALPVIRLFEELGIDYHVGGSIASSFHGVPRSTHDVDLVVGLRPAHVPLLVARLGDAYYLDHDRIAGAVARRGSFQLLFLRTMLKIDVFVRRDDPLAREEARRRVRVELEGRLPIELASAEDTVLRKLLWFHAGGAVSDRQWQDVQGILKVQRGRLDLGYLRRWADTEGIGALLTRAFADASIAEPSPSPPGAGSTG